MKLVRPFVLIAACVALAAPIALAQPAKPVAKPVAKPAAPAKPAADPAAKLPAPILTAFRTSYPNATIKGAAKETEGGKTVWEVESIDNGLARDLIYNPDGTVVEFEEQIDPASLPAAVSAALKAKYPAASITKAEKLMKGTTITYEMALKGAAVKAIEITPDGKVVPVKKEGKEEDEAAEARKAKTAKK
jgi:hypothetical protein